LTPPANAYLTHFVTFIEIKEDAMLRVHELTHFGTPTRAAAPELPSAALAGAAWTQTDADPFFAEISPAAMGYRKAPKVRSTTRRGR
jgi:hypothetical protein